MEPCSIGIALKEYGNCHKTIYTNGKVGICNFTQLESLDKELLLLRSGCTDLTDDHTVCLHHQKYFLVKYSFLQKHCCDPFGLHPTTKRRNSLRILTVEKAKELTEYTGKPYKPGQKWCPPCVIKFSEFTEAGDDRQMVEDAPMTTRWNMLIMLQFLQLINMKLRLCLQCMQIKLKP